jgi:hypothetical protein
MLLIELTSMAPLGGKPASGFYNVGKGVIPIFSSMLLKKALLQSNACQRPLTLFSSSRRLLYMMLDNTISRDDITVGTFTVDYVIDCNSDTETIRLRNDDVDDYASYISGFTIDSELLLTIKRYVVQFCTLDVNYQMFVCSRFLILFQ